MVGRCRCSGEKRFEEEEKKDDHGIFFCSCEHSIGNDSITDCSNKSSKLSLTSLFVISSGYFVPYGISRTSLLVVEVMCAGSFHGRSMCNRSVTHKLNKDFLDIKMSVAS